MFQYTSPRLKWLAEHVRGSTIVDIGFAGIYSATTAHTLIRQNNPTSRIIPIDINLDLVMKHKTHNAVLADGYHLPLANNSVSTVVMAEVLEHLPDWIRFVQEGVRIIQPKGRIVITTPNPYGLLRWLRHWLYPSKPGNATNTRNYLGFHEHTQFIDPLALAHLLTDLGFRVELTTTNLSLPYVPKRFRDPHLNFWPLNRVGTYTCLMGVKRSYAT